MLTPVSVALGIVAFVLLLPTASDLLSLLAIALGRGQGIRRTHGEEPRLMFLVPAHDEEMLIERCIRSLLDMEYPQDRHTIVVIADNCSDDTAAIVRSLGVECLERKEPGLPGKPRAIAWALERLPVKAHDAVVIVDADTTIDAGYCRAIARVPNLREGAAQAYNGISNPGDSALTRMAYVLATAYYRFMYPLKERANINPPLTGAGMCIGTVPLEEQGWRAFSLSEDVEMFVRLTLEGVRTHCVPQARIRAQEAASLGMSSSQRTRWRAGRLSILGHHGLSLLTARGVSARQRLDLVSELAVPGPAVHLGLAAALSPIALLAPLPGGSWIGAALLLSLVRPATYTILAIARDEEPASAVRAFMYLPFYTVWRLATELLAVKSVGDKPWIRTGRHDPAGNGAEVDREAT